MQPEKEIKNTGEIETGAGEQRAMSEVWQQLLGGAPLDADKLAALKEAIPTLESDPWSALLQAKGVEMVDLRQLHLSDQDVEQVLQLMQEQASQNPEY